MHIRHFVPYVLLTVSSITYAIPPNLQTNPIAKEIKESIEEFLQDCYTYEELIQLVTDLENGVNLEDKYPLEEINAFLACVAKLGILVQESPESHLLNESLLELLQNEDEDTNYTFQDSPSWYKDIYFPNELPHLTIETCSLNPVKALKKVGKAVKKGLEKTIKITKKTIQEIAKLPKKAEKAIRKSFKKSTKKQWDKTKKFIKKHKKAIIIGLVVVTIVVLAITIGPELLTLLAGVIPASSDDSSQQQTPIVSSHEDNQGNYTEDNFVEDCIEIVQEQLIEKGFNNLTAEECESFSILETIKNVGSGISHQLIDGLDSTIQTFALLSNNLEYPIQLNPNLTSSGNSLFTQGLETASNTIAYLHQKTDELFDTSLADSYTQEAKAFREECGIQYYEGVVPLPGSSILGKTSPKELLKKFTKSNYRNNLKKAQPLANYAEVEAHHVFPQAEKLQKNFNNYGINVHDPQYLTWWEKNAHRSNSHAYNLEWEKFFNETPNITKEKILKKGKQLMEKYGIEPLY